MPDRTIQTIHSILLDRFGPEIILGVVEATDPWIEVAPNSIAEVALFLRDDPRLRFDHLNDLTAVDYLEPDPAKASRFPFQPHVAVVYHLSSFERRQHVVIKAKLPRWHADQPGQIPHIPSVAEIWPIADWHEREAYDLMGVYFEGHSNLVRMMMPDDWQGHPLRKDYTWPEDYHGIRAQ